MLPTKAAWSCSLFLGSQVETEKKKILNTKQDYKGIHKKKNEERSRC